MFATLVRILLISSLVAWSPAWCCCAVRAMAAGQLSVEAIASEGFSCCSRSAAPRADRSPRCCIENGDRSCCGESGPACGDDQSPCRCADRVIEQQRLDTSLKVSAPKSGEDLLAALAAGPAEHAAHRMVTVRSQIFRSWHPPPRTLLSQSCLLVV